MSLSKQELEFLKESNLIENVTGSTVAAELAWEFLLEQEKLTHRVILQAHKILMFDQPYPAKLGWYRNVSKYDVMVGGRVAPSWSMVEALMDNWLLDYGTMSPKEAHIRFEHIHPFADGNGRIGRMLYNWQRLKVGEPLHIIHHGKEQQEYYKWFQEDQN